MNLASLSPGQSARITKLHTENLNLIRLAEMGLIEGTEVTLVRRAPFGDPLQVRVMNSLLCLRKADAGTVSVELLT